MSKGDVDNTADQRNVWWGFRDSAWLRRAKFAGQTYVKTLGVTRRAKRDRAEYEATKTKAYADICEWQRRVEGGGDPGTGVTIVQSDLRADQVSQSAIDDEDSPSR